MNDEIIIDVVLGAESKSLVINETRVAGNKAWGGGYVLQRFRTTKSKVLEAMGIQDVPDINVGNKWIPCSERLPNDTAIHEVTAKFSNGTIYTEFAYYNESIEEWWKFDDDGIVNVIAWKEHSEPYKEGDT